MRSVTLIILILAVLLDVAAATAITTTPSRGSLSQANLIWLSLPCTSLTLAVVVNLIAFIRLPDTEDNQAGEELTSRRITAYGQLIPTANSAGAMPSIV